MTTTSNVTLIITPLFPRNSNTNGYNLPKMHGITKMQEYMALFGSGINFYDGPGESAHKQFFKYQDREHSKESVILHNRLHFNTTLC